MTKSIILRRFHQQFRAVGRAECLAVALFFVTGSAGADITRFRNAVLDDNPIAFWQLEETSGTSVADSSGNGNTATHEASPSVGATGIGGSNGVHYNGSGARTRTADSAVYTPSIGGANTGHSLEAWVKPSSSATATQARNIAAWNGPAADTYRMQQRGMDNNQAGGWVRDASSNSFSLQGGPPAIDDGEWHHVVLTFGLDAGSNPFRRVYMDGALTDSDPGALSGFGLVDSLVIAADDTGGGVTYHGLIDEVAVYGYALSDDRILAHYNLMLDIPVPVTHTNVMVNGVVEFEFQSSSNVNYRLECSTNMTNWVPLNIIIEGLGQTETTFDPSGFDSNKAYRVVAF